MHMRTLAVAYICCVLSACSCGSGDHAPARNHDAGPVANQPSPREAGPPSFCARAQPDAITAVFCREQPPPLRNLDDLQVLLAFKPAESQAGEYTDPRDAYNLLYSVAVLSHSTSLDGRVVSPINPRVIHMAADTFMAFQRGVQRVELIARAPGSNTLQFYLVEFEQDCNAQPSGCTPGDLYTPRIEFDWRKVTIRDGVDLANTPQDCRVCHERGLERPALLMRELEDPWTHFFLPPIVDQPGVSGGDLLHDYLEAKGDEPYAGFPLRAISNMAPFFLEGLAGPTQPLLFDAPLIQFERHPYRDDGYVEEPQTSPAWERAYEAFKRGEQLALPYVEPRATDPHKQAALTDMYRRYRAQEIDASELPDLADIFPDGGHERARRGLSTEPDASAEDTLIQACASCHSDALDQTITRARFNIRVSSLDRERLDTAIERLRLPPTAAGAMPPPSARQLDPGARERLIDYLRAEPSALDADGVLDRAASLGMLGGAGQRRAATAL